MNILAEVQSFALQIGDSIYKKFVSKFVRPSWLSSQAFDEKRENWWQVSLLGSFRKTNWNGGFSEFFSCSWLDVYKDIWKPSIGDKLASERELDNFFGKFAIEVVNNGETVGNLPCKFLTIAWYRIDFNWCFGDDSRKIKEFFPDVLADKSRFWAKF